MQAWTYSQLIDTKKMHFNAQSSCLQLLIRGSALLMLAIVHKLLL